MCLKLGAVGVEAFLGYLTGLRFVAGEMPLPNLIATALAINICNGIMCRLFAHNNGYPKNLWTLLGFIFGIWAVALLILLPKRGSDDRPEQG